MRFFGLILDAVRAASDQRSLQATWCPCFCYLITRRFVIPISSPPTSEPCLSHVRGQDFLNGGKTCGGNGPAIECIWEVTLPDCPAEGEQRVITPGIQYTSIAAARRPLWQRCAEGGGGCLAVFATGKGAAYEKTYEGILDRGSVAHRKRDDLGIIYIGCCKVSSRLD